MPAMTKDDVVRLMGPVSDHTVVEILQLKADMADLEAVAMRLAQENDVLGKARKALSGAAAAIYDIVVRDALYSRDEREQRRDS